MGGGTGLTGARRARYSRDREEDRVKRGMKKGMLETLRWNEI